VGDRGAAPQAREPADADTDEAREPFAVELGTAAAFRGGFAVGALTLAGQPRAQVALVDREGGHGRSVDLGPTHGGQAAPHVAAHGDRLIVVVPDSDASGREFKLAAIRDVSASATVAWGAERPAGGAGSEVFAVEVNDTRGVVVWDSVDRAERGVIHAMGFPLDDLSKAAPTRVVSPEHTDAQNPALALRPGGFWLAWIAAPVDQPAHRAPTFHDAELEAPGGRVEIVPVDADGAPSAPPIAVTPRGSRVLAYDLAPLPGGGALVGWREEGTTPGVEDGAVRLTAVLPDGSVQQSELSATRAAAGVPALISDAEARDPLAPLWVSVDNGAGVTLFGAANASAAPIDTLGPEPAIGPADVLAVAGGRTLVARPVHRVVELGVLECRPGPVPNPAQAASSAAPSADDSDLGPLEVPLR
jgi:hypothetical protein